MSDETATSLFIMCACLVLLLFDCYRTNAKVWKLKREVEKNKALVYKVSSNGYALIMYQLFDVGLLKLPEDYDGTIGTLIADAYAEMFPEAKNYVETKDGVTGDDV